MPSPSGYTTRVLPVEEWGRLAGTEAESLLPLIHPESTTVLVVEQDGVIVGSWLAMRVLHLEALWIAPAHRGHAAVGRRLLIGMRALVRHMGATGVIVSAIAESMRRMIATWGGIPLPGDHYVVRVTRERT